MCITLMDDEQLLQLNNIQLITGNYPFQHEVSDAPQEH